MEEAVAQVINLPEKLDELVSYKFPDALWVDGWMHSETVYTLEVLDLDYRMTVWLATLSLDGRWTLSPREGPWQGTPVSTIL